MLKIKKTDTQILRELKANQNKLTNLDANFLFGRIEDKDYFSKREELRKNVKKIIEKEKLRLRFKQEWKNLK